MPRAVNKFVLVLGKLKLPMSCFKSVDNTTSIYAKEVAKVNGKVYSVKRKPYVVLDDGTEQDIDSSQILKSYERDDGEIALFSKEEQSQLLKKGSSREWIVNAIVDKNQFGELDFQKDGIIAMPELDKKKQLLNKKFLKFFAMLKAGLGEEKAIVTQILYKNVEYPVVISNYENKMLIRFLHYRDEIRDIDGSPLPKLSEQETEQAKAFVKQYHNPKFDLKSFENKTAEQVMKLINQRGTDVKEAEAEIILTEEDNPFAITTEKEDEALAKL